MNDLTKSERLRSFILENVDSLEFEAFGFPFDEVPDFELHARDYLQYAKEEINRGADINLINCIGNLKRALDCQVDSYLHTFNLLDLVRGKNLGIDKKLEFLSKVGIFSSRSLSRFNTIRNKIEHEYKAPHIEDIDVYFDLISAFTSILERETLIHSELEGFFNGIRNQFTIKYQRDQICIEVNWGQYDEDALKKGEVKLKNEPLIACAKKDIDEFTFFFRVLNLMSLLAVRHSSRSYVKSQLKGI
ncbi:MAG: hypothetical protein MH825_08890 [Cyanobacteria bacterium]|nr:hypothetical protein [Cyanobacteriota bacterium]